MKAKVQLAPPGLLLVADSGLIRRDARTFVGGAPLRSLRISNRGVEVFERWLGGGAVGDSHAERRLARRFLEAGLVHPCVKPSAVSGCTVVIPVRDDATGLDQTLSALGEGDVVVVDDGSLDAGEVAAIAGRYGARLVRRPTPGGPAAARMTALDSVDSPFVAFVDAGVVPRHDWLDKLQGHFLDEAVVAVAPRVQSVPGPTVRERYEQDHSPLDLGLRPSLVGPGRAVAYVPSAALVVRREPFVEVGGFDCELRFGEDVDLVWRLGAAGWAVRYDPSVEVCHAPRSSWPQWWRQRVGYGCSAAALGQRHGAAVAPARGNPLIAAATAAGALGHPVVGSALAGLSFESARRSLSDIVGTNLASQVARRSLVGSARAYLAALTRAWWPLALFVVIVSAKSRRSMAAMIVVSSAADWHESEGNVDATRGVAIRILDNVAYGVGVWRGCLAQRSFVALRPSLSGGRLRFTGIQPTTARDV